MKALLAALTVANFILLVFLGAQMRPAQANAQAGVLRGSALEIVDDKGRVRASIKVQSDGPILRLIDSAGRPGVKMGSGGESTGLLLLGATDTTFVRLIAKGKESTLEVKDDRLEATMIRGSPVATK
jgi:hypothetical protein